MIMPSQQSYVGKQEDQQKKNKKRTRKFYFVSFHWLKQQDLSLSCLVSYGEINC